MIIAELAGGLANQMVVYAAARSLSVRKQTELKLDLSFLAKDMLRSFQLHHLNIAAEIASIEEIARVRHSSKFKIIEKFKRDIRKKFGLSVPYIYQEPVCQCDDNFWALPDDVYVSGNFISIRYFKEIAPILRNDFSVISPLSSQTTELCRRIADCNSVSIHVRRGDYASNPHTKAFHGLLGVDYYARAIKQIEARVAHPVFFFFSDDIAWVKENITTVGDIVWVDHVGQENAYEDMHMMKLCKHNILANSGFSYWPAWLNENVDKIVIAPQLWCADAKFNALFDLIPEEWCRL